MIDTQFLITCFGMLSAPHMLFPGQETFEGQLFHAARWPKQPVDFAGKRVGIIGNGTTGIQVIQTIAGEVSHLKVFIRTPQYTIPMKNPKYSAADAEARKSKFKLFTERLPHTRTPYFVQSGPAITVDRREERCRPRSACSLTKTISIAEAYWCLYGRRRDRWTHELDLRPSVEI